MQLLAQLLNPGAAPGRAPLPTPRPNPVNTPWGTGAPDTSYFPPAPPAFGPYGPSRGGARNWISNNSEALAAMSQALLSGRTGPEQFGGAFGAFAAARAGQKKKNKTLEWIGARSPELAQAMEMGIIDARDAFKMLNEKPEKPKRTFQKFDDGTYGYFNEDDGTFNPLGKAGGKTDEYTERQQAAERFGMSQDDPAYKSFLLTGKMPREDQAPLSATDKRAILEADEMVLAAQSTIPLLDRALELNKQAYDGPTAGLRGTITGNLGSESGEATMELENVVTSQALSQLKSIFGAAPTEGERKILMEMAGSVSQPAPIREAIFQRAKQLAERRMNFYRERSNELRGGTFYKPEAGGQPAPAGILPPPSPRAAPVNSPQGGGVTRTGTQWRVKPAQGAF